MAGQYGKGSHFQGSPTGQGAGQYVSSGGGNVSPAPATTQLTSAATPTGSNDYRTGLRPQGITATGQFEAGALSATSASTGQVFRTPSGQPDIATRQAFENIDFEHLPAGVTPEMVMEARAQASGGKITLPSEAPIAFESAGARQISPSYVSAPQGRDVYVQEAQHRAVAGLFARAPQIRPETEKPFNQVGYTPSGFTANSFTSYEGGIQTTQDANVPSTTGSGWGGVIAAFREGGIRGGLSAIQQRIKNQTDYQTQMQTGAPIPPQTAQPTTDDYQARLAKMQASQNLGILPAGVGIVGATLTPAQKGIVAGYSPTEKKELGKSLRSAYSRDLLSEGFGKLQSRQLALGADIKQAQAETARQPWRGEKREFSPLLTAKVEQFQSVTGGYNIKKTLREGTAADFSQLGGALMRQLEKRPAPKTFYDLLGKPQAGRYTDEESRTASRKAVWATGFVATPLVGAREIQQFIIPVGEKGGFEKRTFAQRTERAGKYIPEIVTTGLLAASLGTSSLLPAVASKFPVAGQFLPAVIPTAFTAYAGYQFATKPTFENALSLTAIGAFSIPSIASSALRAKEVLGVEAVRSESSVFGKAGLEGGVPKQKSVASTIEAFQKQYAKFPESKDIIGAPKAGVIVAHARAGGFPKETEVWAGFRGDKGMFVTSKGSASYRFTGLQSPTEAGSSPTFSVLPPSALPRVLEIRTSGLEILGKPQLATEESFAEALKASAGTGKAVLPTRGFAKGTGYITDVTRRGTAEEEALIPETTKLLELPKQPKTLSYTRGGPVRVVQSTVIMDAEKAGLSISPRLKTMSLKEALGGTVSPYESNYALSQMIGTISGVKTSKQASIKTSSAKTSSLASPFSDVLSPLSVTPSRASGVSGISGFSGISSGFKASDLSPIFSGIPSPKISGKVMPSVPPPSIISPPPSIITPPPSIVSPSPSWITSTTPPPSIVSYPPLWFDNQFKERKGKKPKKKYKPSVIAIERGIFGKTKGRKYESGVEIRPLPETKAMHKMLSLYRGGIGAITPRRANPAIQSFGIQRQKTNYLIEKKKATAHYTLGLTRAKMNMEKRRSLRMLGL